MTKPQKKGFTTTSYHNSTKREPVLLLVHADHWVEVFAEKHIDVWIEMIPQMKTQADELLAQEYVEGLLPKRYRDVYWPGNLRVAELIRAIRPIDIEVREYDLAMLRAIHQLGDKQQEARRTWTL